MLPLLTFKVLKIRPFNCVFLILTKFNCYVNLFSILLTLQRRSAVLFLQFIHQTTNIDLFWVQVCRRDSSFKNRFKVGFFTAVVWANGFFIAKDSEIFIKYLAQLKDFDDRKKVRQLFKCFLTRRFSVCLT